MDAVHRVALRILGALALAMGLEEDHFLEVGLGFRVLEV